MLSILKLCLVNVGIIKFIVLYNPGLVSFTALMLREVFNVFLLPARPGKPQISSQAGLEVVEGGEVRLYCTTKGGDPTPTITWRKDSVPLPAVGLDIDNTSGQVRSSLVISQISSRDQASNVSCTATNSDLVEPVTSSVIIQVIGEQSNQGLLQEEKAFG